MSLGLFSCLICYYYSENMVKNTPRNFWMDIASNWPKLKFFVLKPVPKCAKGTSCDGGIGLQVPRHMHGIFLLKRRPFLSPLPFHSFLHFSLSLSFLSLNLIFIILVLSHIAFISYILITNQISSPFTDWFFLGHSNKSLGKP